MISCHGVDAQPRARGCSKPSCFPVDVATVASRYMDVAKCASAWVSSTAQIAHFQQQGFLRAVPRDGVPSVSAQLLLSPRIFVSVLLWLDAPAMCLACFGWPSAAIAQVPLPHPFTLCVVALILTPRVRHEVAQPRAGSRVARLRGGSSADGLRPRRLRRGLRGWCSGLGV